MSELALDEELERPDHALAEPRDEEAPCTAGDVVERLEIGP
jgi:hypothetical protein